MADVPKEVRDYFSKLGKRTAKAMTPAQRKQRAKAASDAAHAAMTAEERSARAKKAAQAKWAALKKKKPAADK